jgi:hypothetical protein
MAAREIRTSKTDALFKFVSRIGTCGKCMRQAFQAAFLALCLCAPAWVAGWMFNSSGPIWAAGSATAFLTALWMLHVIVFGIRIARKSVARIGPAGAPASAGVGAEPTKRAFLTVFAKAVAAVAAATVLPSRLALAYGNCNDPGSFPCNTTFCVPNGAQNACCPASNRYLNHCDCRCYVNSSDFSCGSYTYCS